MSIVLSVVASFLLVMAAGGGQHTNSVSAKETIVSNTARVTAYWETVLPSTPMPSAILDLLTPTAGNDHIEKLNNDNIRAVEKRTYEKYVGAHHTNDGKPLYWYGPAAKTDDEKFPYRYGPAGKTNDQKFPYWYGLSTKFNSKKFPYRYGPTTKSNDQKFPYWYGPSTKSNDQKFPYWYGPSMKSDDQKFPYWYGPSTKPNDQKFPYWYGPASKSNDQEFPYWYGPAKKLDDQKFPYWYGPDTKSNDQKFPYWYGPGTKSNDEKFPYWYGPATKSNDEKFPYWYGPATKSNNEKFPYWYGPSMKSNDQKFPYWYDPDMKFDDKRFPYRYGLATKSKNKKFPYWYGLAMKSNDQKFPYRYGPATKSSDNKEINGFSGSSPKGASNVQVDGHEIEGHMHGDFTFSEDSLLPGSTFIPYILPSANLGAPLLQRDVADSIPISTRNFTDIMAMFEPASYVMADDIWSTLNMCEHVRPLNGEKKTCIGSVESMVEFVSSVLGGTRDLQAFSSSQVPTEGIVTRRRYKVTTSRRLTQSNVSATCHGMSFPYAVFMCHAMNPTRVFIVELESEDGAEKMEVLAVCHLDTSGFDPSKMPKNIKPGDAPACHFVGRDTVLWAPSTAAAAV